MKKRRVAIAAPPAKSRVAEEDAEEKESIAPVPTKKCRVHTAAPPAEEKRDKVGKMSGSGMKFPNDQGGLTGALGKKCKHDEDVPGAVTQAPRPIANLLKCRNNT
ncbi:hypothetical protein BT96DRAFT_937703 [Gymnopus androsaceus JB14]|uniref:Uncharacterized protein n=1 Tax=Gymnopus androsaceus JB14 TaxID=1447944 RepID=A0A6A4HWQ6_9AGAR|nr:hypothetical protein BT96DRAFT_937703 [Gymnopus androsaceus JB14]